MDSAKLGKLASDCYEFVDNLDGINWTGDYTSVCINSDYMRHWDIRKDMNDGNGGGYLPTIRRICQTMKKLSETLKHDSKL